MIPRLEKSLMVLIMVYENEREMNTRYVVRVWDNFHYMQESEAYNAGEFATYEEAVAAAKVIVERSMAEFKNRLEEWLMFGDDPGIICPEGTNHPTFSARDYARELAEKQS